LSKKKQDRRHATQRLGRGPPITVADCKSHIWPSQCQLRTPTDRICMRPVTASPATFRASNALRSFGAPHPIVGRRNNVGLARRAHVVFSLISIAWLCKRMAPDTHATRRVDRVAAAEGLATPSILLALGVAFPYPRSTCRMPFLVDPRDQLPAIATRQNFQSAGCVSSVLASPCYRFPVSADADHASQFLTSAVDLPELDQQLALCCAPPPEAADMSCKSSTRPYRAWNAPFMPSSCNLPCQLCRRCSSPDAFCKAFLITCQFTGSR